jgi:hypothetical protein
MLRDHSQRSDRKLIEVAEAIVLSHVLLLPPLAPGGQAERSSPGQLPA